MKDTATVSSHTVRGLIAAMSFTIAAAAAGCSGSGGGGGAGAGGGNDAGACDVTKIFSTYTCAAPACHNSTNPAANFDMQTLGWETKLVGVAPKGGGPIVALESKCGAMGKVYLTAGSKPATGLFMDKISLDKPGCGVRMPNIPFQMLSDAEIKCVQAWATALTTK
jgi:hypothetical protein